MRDTATGTTAIINGYHEPYGHRGYHRSYPYRPHYGGYGGGYAHCR